MIWPAVTGAVDYVLIANTFPASGQNGAGAGAFSVRPGAPCGHPGHSLPREETTVLGQLGPATAAHVAGGGRVVEPAGFQLERVEELRPITTEPYSLRLPDGHQVRRASRREKPRQAAETGAWGEERPERTLAFVFGGDEEDRTPDLRIANATLSSWLRPTIRGRNSIPKRAFLKLPKDLPMNTPLFRLFRHLALYGRTATIKKAQPRATIGTDSHCPMESQRQQPEGCPARVNSTRNRTPAADEEQPRHRARCRGLPEYHRGWRIAPGPPAELIEL